MTSSAWEDHFPVNDDRLTAGRATTPRDRGTAAGPARPGTGPESPVNTFTEAAGLVTSILQLDPFAHRPPRPARIPTNLMGNFLTTTAEVQMRAAGVDTVSRGVVLAVLQTALREAQTPLDRALQEIPAVQQYVGWYFAQRSHNQALEAAFVDGLINGLRTNMSSQFNRALNDRGPALVTAHLTIAATSPIAGTPQGAIFWTSAAYHWIVRGIGDVQSLFRMATRPDEVAIGMLKVTHLLLALAFASEAEAQRQARLIGTKMAEAFAEELFSSLFPRVGIVLGERGHWMVSQLQGGLERLLELVISPALVPWTLGAFVGPLLVDLVLAIIGLLIPGFGLGALAWQAGRRIRVIREILNGIESIAAATRRLAGRLGLPGGHVDVPSARGITAESRSIAPAHRGLEIEAPARPRVDAPAASPRPVREAEGAVRPHGETPGAAHSAEAPSSRGRLRPAEVELIDARGRAVPPPPRRGGQFSIANLRDQHGDRFTWVPESEGGAIAEVTMRYEPRQITSRGSRHRPTSRAAGQARQATGAAEGAVRFDAGHVRAAIMDGIAEAITAFPQSSKINRGAWRDVEARVNRLLESMDKMARRGQLTDPRLHMNIKFRYSSLGTTRPEEFIASIRVPGSPTVRLRVPNRPVDLRAVTNARVGYTIEAWNRRTHPPDLYGKAGIQQLRQRTTRAGD